MAKRESLRLRLDAAVAQAVRRIAVEHKLTLGEVVENALRAVLPPEALDSAPKYAVKVKPGRIAGRDYGASYPKGEKKANSSQSSPTSIAGTSPIG
jgi:hypothetical protein